MEWYETAMKYGFKPTETEAQLLDDPDVRLVPSLIEKIVLPKLTGQTTLSVNTIILFSVDLLKHLISTALPFQNSLKKRGIRSLHRKHYVWSR